MCIYIYIHTYIYIYYMPVEEIFLPSHTRRWGKSYFSSWKMRGVSKMLLAFLPTIFSTCKKVCSVQNLCWLMISSWIVLPNILGIMNTAQVECSQVFMFPKTPSWHRILGWSLSTCQGETGLPHFPCVYSRV